MFPRKNAAANGGKIIKLKKWIASRADETKNQVWIQRNESTFFLTKETKSRKHR